MDKQVRVGVGTFIRKDGKILLGRRNGAHAGGVWGPPGGHVDFGETPDEAALREISEEVGCSVKNLQRGPWGHNIFVEEGKQTISLLFVCDYESGDIVIKEPDKCEEWKWFSWNDIPEEVFQSIKEVVAEGFDPYEDRFSV